MADPMDDRYATFREHAELRERTATLEETVRQVGPSLNRIETMIVAQKAAPQPTQHDSVILAVHDLAKSVRESRSGGGHLGYIILITLALIGVGLAAFLIGRAF
jgi:hypothetical protein